MAGMDVYAAGLRVALKMVEDNFLENIYKERYSSFDSGIGADFEADKATFKDFEDYILNKTNDEIFATIQSGRLKLSRQPLNNYIYSVLGTTFQQVILITSFSKIIICKKKRAQQATMNLLGTFCVNKVL